MASWRLLSETVSSVPSDTTVSSLTSQHALTSLSRRLLGLQAKQKWGISLEKNFRATSNARNEAMFEVTAVDPYSVWCTTSVIGTMLPPESDVMGPELTLSLLLCTQEATKFAAHLRTGTVSLHQQLYAAPLTI